jgi:hypothetical protein
MAQRNKMKSATKNIPSRRSRTERITTLEQLSPEIFFDIFDYLTGNEIYISFFGLSRQINELVYNTPNVHLDLSRTTTKFYQNFQRIFSEKNFVSVVLSAGDYVSVLQRLFNPTAGRRLKSMSLMDLPFYTFQTRIPEIFSTFKHQLVSLKIKFTGPQDSGSGAQTAQSFAYLLTELPLLKYLTLGGSVAIDSMTHMNSTIINNTVVSLTISLPYRSRWVPLLYRFEKLKILTIDFYSICSRMRAARPGDARDDYGSQSLGELSVNYPFRLRHIKLYQYDMVLENFEQLFRVLISPTLLTLSLFNCQRPVTKYPLPKRRPPFLDGTQWHDLVKTYLPPTMKQFYIEYEDVDNTMSMTNLVQVKKEFMKYSGQNLPWDVSCSYDKITKFLSFRFTFI